MKDKLQKLLRFIHDNLRPRRFFQRFRKQMYAFLALFIIVLLQSTLLNYFRIFNVKPDAILASLVIYVNFFNLGWSLFFAFLGGIFKDAFSVFSFGFNTITCILWIILARQVSRRLSFENNFIRSGLLCLIILLNNLTLQSIMLVLGRHIVMADLLKVAAIESIFTLILAMPLYRFFVYLFMDKQ